MEPPPLPTGSGRFRLRVQVFPPQEAPDLNMAPLRQFTIVKTPLLALPDLTLQELCDEVVKRFKVIYPGESLFAVEKPQDSYGSDLYLGDRVRDVFEDNEIFRVIKGASIRASVEPHRARSQSVQPNGIFPYSSVRVGKRNHNRSDTEDTLRSQKRQRTVASDPDRPLRSRECDTIERNDQPPGELTREVTCIQDSQNIIRDDRVGQYNNRLSSQSIKSGSVNSNQARQNGSMVRRHPISIASSLAWEQHIPTPKSASLKEDVATSDSESWSRQSRASSRSKRKLDFRDDFSEQDREHSISTALTTPQSVLQQAMNQSPAIDNKKLRRPTVRAGKHNTADQHVTKVLPRQNVYEVIETDTEHPTARPLSQDVSSKLSNSYKWRAYRSSTTPNSDKSSPYQRRNIVAEENNLEFAGGHRPNHEAQQQNLEKEPMKLADQETENERSRLASQAAEKKQLAAEKEKARQKKVESDRVIAEKLRKEMGVQEDEAGRKRDALNKAEAAEEFELAEKTRQEAETNVRLEEQRKARVESEERARKATDANKLQLEINRSKEAEKWNSFEKQALIQPRKEKEQKSRDFRASLEATVRRAATTPAKGISAHESHSAAGPTPDGSDRGAAANNGPTARDKRVTCTPFIPRGKPSGFSPAILHLPQAGAGAIPRVPSPNVGLEDQMPMPPNLKRRVSFADQTPPSARRSSSVSSTLKQTTLVPPRLGITDVKSTPKRTPLKANLNSSKLAKGKAKVVESPGKPSTPTIEISSDEEFTINPREPLLRQINSKGVGIPGPAYHKRVVGTTFSPPKPQPYTEVPQVNEKVESRRNMSDQVAEKSHYENSQHSSTNTVFTTSQRNKGVTNSASPLSPVRSSISPAALRPNAKALLSQAGVLELSNDPPGATKASQRTTNKQVKSSHIDTQQQSATTNSDSEEESDSIEVPDVPEPATMFQSTPSSQQDTNHLKDSQGEASDAEFREEFNPNENHRALQLKNITALTRDQSGDLGDIEKETEKETEKEITEEETSEGSDEMQPVSRDTSTDEELDEYSDGMQAQVDDQLLTQSFESSSSPQNPPRISATSNDLPAAKYSDVPQKHGSERPSLRRMNLEAQLTKEANLEAAKARGLAKAKNLQGSSKPNGLLEESSGEASSSGLSSTSSEYETDGQEHVVHTRSKTSKAYNTRENPGDLNSKDVEEMSEQLLANSAEGNFHPSASRSAPKSSLKRPDLMFRPTSKLISNEDGKGGKKSAKIGWAKLGKHFSASKRKSGI